MAFPGTELTMKPQPDLYSIAARHLPSSLLTSLHPENCANGEGCFHDIAEVWKRILQYRLAMYLPDEEHVLETHAGYGVGRRIMLSANPRAEITSLDDYHQVLNLGGLYGLIDIDPFGQPWDVLDVVLPFLKPDGILCITNGEALAVWRNLKKQQRYPTYFFGKQMGRWVVEEYIPRLEAMTGLRCSWFYAYPSSVRVILSRHSLPSTLWHECPRWMWWLQKYNEASYGLCSASS